MGCFPTQAEWGGIKRELRMQESRMKSWFYCFLGRLTGRLTSLKKAVETHSSTLAWKIPWTEEPGRLRSMGLWRVGHDWATSLSFFTFHFHALEKEMATHSSVLAWRIPGTGEPGGLPSMGSHRVIHDWSDLAAATFLNLINKSFPNHSYLLDFCKVFMRWYWRKKWQPTPVFLPGESQGWGSLVGCCLWGHTESDTTETT